MAMQESNLAEYLNRRFAAQEQHQVLGFPRNPTSRTGFRYFTPRELGTFTDRAAAHCINHGLQLRRKGDQPLIVGIYGPGAIEWVATYFAVIVMGHTPLIISSRLSEDAAEGLLKKAGAEVLVRSSSKEAASRALSRSIPVVTLEQLEDTTQPTIKTRCDPDIIDKNTGIAYILHSSGSTGLPKLFEKTHHDAVRNFQTKNKVLASMDRNWVSSAVYNVVELWLLTSSLLQKQPVVYDNDRLPFTAEGLNGILEEFRPTTAFVTSYSLEMITMHARGIDNLLKCNHVIHFGAVLPTALGDDLVQRGVRLSTLFGMSEAGSLLSSRPRPEGDTAWDYVAPVAGVKPHILFRPVGMDGSGIFSCNEEQLYELICLETSDVMERLKTSDDPPGSYHTGDLFLKHPSKEDRWKAIGRMDDQLKIYHEDRQAVVNGLVYEEKIKKGNEDVIDEVVLFGQGQSKLGILVFAESATTGHTKQAVIERAWASIESEINDREKIGIDKEMIAVVSGVPAQSLPRTAKLNFIRPQIYRGYKEQIDGAYNKNTGVDANANGHM